MLRAVLAERPDGFGNTAKAVLVGGARVPVELQEAARAAGLPVVATYGMTETASQVATAVPTDPPGSGALPLNGVEFSTGSRDAPADITINGPMVSPGYWGEPDRDGWFETRDFGYLDDAGRLHVIGRSDDVIISGGENIHPAEVEVVLESMEAVQAAAVFGIPDDVWGERLEAAVVLADGTATAESIEADLRVSLPDFKIPKRLHLVAELPLGPTGKVDRKALAEMTDRPPPTAHRPPPETDSPDR
jgi:O-succinylbenzoic acid--CoA ligase